MKVMKTEEHHFTEVYAERLVTVAREKNRNCRDWLYRKNDSSD